MPRPVGWGSGVTSNSAPPPVINAKCPHPGDVFCNVVFVVTLILFPSGKVPLGQLLAKGHFAAASSPPPHCRGCSYARPWVGTKR